MYFLVVEGEELFGLEVCFVLVAGGFVLVAGVLFAGVGEAFLAAVFAFLVWESWF